MGDQASHSRMARAILAIACVTSVATQAVARRGNQGCCSWHGGVDGCDRDVGSLVCNDGTYSPSCGCEKRNPWIMQNGRRTMPDGAEPNAYNDGWECRRGYQQMGSQCLQIQVPPNAELDYFGSSWECSRGYRQVGAQCMAVQVPANATLGYDGHTWECDSGYRQLATTCVPVDVPANAAIDYTATAGNAIQDIVG
jgi:hypothetical protein